MRERVWQVAEQSVEWRRIGGLCFFLRGKMQSASNRSEEEDSERRRKDRLYSAQALF